MNHTASQASPADVGTGTGVPQHIAIVMDGNGRWAKQRHLPRLAGHRQGLSALRTCIQACAERGVAVLTVFAFSSENWARPPEEVSGLMEILTQALARELASLKKQGVRLYFIGERASLPESVRLRLDQAQAETQTAQTDTALGARLVLNVCFNYGGRWDIAQAARHLAEQGIAPTEESMGRAMALAHVGDPDLLIRTGGEQRISNFLLWQLAYTELYFSPQLWPDFAQTDLDEALAAYAQRERRFGKVPASAAVASSPSL